jgi:MoaA/NifB/PqqE/SkfB family radical SAM enzyme
MQPETDSAVVQFRGDGAFVASIAGFKSLRTAGMSMQINTTIAKHNFRKLDETYRLALEMGADALHLFMLVPVGCGAELSPDIMLDSEEYEQTLAKRANYQNEQARASWGK